ncbi:MAG: YebC/PmpR family DNA-binding transcriptional regulator [Thermoanaerobaculia bacterium]|nr:YebC/PmpR family DNA-binding transcriptional regulator [Thermoanaerobaculia bacterium]
MSGHNKWSTIKHKKAAADARRGKLWTRIIREITVAARLGGGDPEANPRLRTAVNDAKAANMPKDNIERAIKKGTGELEGETYEEITYEGYASGGVAMIIEAMTDNTNRTTPEIRHILEKHGGNLGTPGSASYLFERKGFFSIDKSEVDEDKLMEIALESGAEDLDTDDPETYAVYTAPENYDNVSNALDKAAVPTVEAKIGQFPMSYVKVDDEGQARKILTLMEALDDHDDVQNVWSNFDIPDELVVEA